MTITEQDLFDSFIGVRSDGKAVSVLWNNQKLVWSYLIAKPKIQKSNFYIQLTYAMLAATMDEKDRVIPQINIQILPEGGVPVMIAARSTDVKHPIIEKLKKHFPPGGTGGS